MEVALCTSKSDELSILAADTVSPGSSNSNIYRDTQTAFSNGTSLLASAPSSTTGCTSASFSMTTSTAAQLVVQTHHPALVTSLQSRLQTVVPDNIDLDSSTLSPEPDARSSPTTCASGSHDAAADFSSGLCTVTAAASPLVTVTLPSSPVAQSDPLPTNSSNSSQPSPELGRPANSHVPSESLPNEPIDIVDLSNDENSMPPITKVPENSWTVSSSGIFGSACVSTQVMSTVSSSNKTLIGESTSGTTGQLSLPSTTTSSSSSLLEAPVSCSATNSPVTLTNALLSANSYDPNRAGGLPSKPFSTAPIPIDHGLAQSVNSSTIHPPGSSQQTTISTTTATSALTTGPAPFRPPGCSTDLVANTNGTRLPVPSTPAPLPPHFPFTLTPISPNGDFPAVHFSLPGFPMVILQVLPLPGARMGEHYTINVPTQLILNGVASAIANGGTVNGGPIVLSIAPSGTLPPGVVPPASAYLPPTGTQPVATTPAESIIPNAPADSLATSTSGNTTGPVGVLNQSSSLPCSTPNFPNPLMSSTTSAVIPNTMTNIHFPGLVISPTSIQTSSNPNSSINNTSKRMRAIAPKPCQKLVTVAPAASATSLSGRGSTTVNSKANVKRQNNTPSVVVVSCTAPMPIVSAVPVTVTSGIPGSPQTISCSTGKPLQTKRISIMPAGAASSSARHGRGRRKGIGSVFNNNSNNLTPLISPMTMTNGFSCSVPVSSSAQTIMTNTNQHEQCMTTRNSLQPPAPSQMQQPMFTNQPLIVSNPNAQSMLTGGPMMPTGQMPPTFLFSGALPTFPPAGGTTGTSTSASGAPPYLFQPTLPLPNGCSQFPVSMYNTVSCATSMPLSTTCPVAVVRSLHTASSGSLFPSGAHTALATVDPSSGMITHFPTPCMPMGVPYSSNQGVTTDQNSFAALPTTMMYSQQGLLLPNVSQPGSMVYPIPGPIPSGLSHTVTSTASMICPNQSGLGQPFPTTTFMSNCSSGTLLPNATLPNSLQVPSTFAPMMTEQQTFLPSLTGYDPMQSQHPSLLAPCTTDTNQNNQNNNQQESLCTDVMDSSCGAVSSSLNTITVNLDEDSNNSIAKDDLITLAWRLTQLKGSEITASLMEDGGGQQQQQEPLTEMMESADDGSGGGGMLDALFDTYTDDRAYVNYPNDELTCGVVLSEVDNPELGALRSAGLTEETDEIVLLDGKSSPYDEDIAPTGTELRLDSDAYANTTEESTGNADIDALLAAAAMVGAASGVGDAQSAVTVAVPCSSALTTVSQQQQHLDTREHKTVAMSHSTTPSSDAVVLSISEPGTICTTTVVDSTPIHPTEQQQQPSSCCNGSTPSVTVATSTPPAMTSCAPGDLPLNSPKETDDILSADFFTEFADHNHDELGQFTEVDEPTSLADVLGCNAEDAADLESVLGPEADRLSGADHVSHSFLHSLVNDSPGLGLDAPDEDDVDDVSEAAHHLFDPDFAAAVCASEQLDGAPESTATEQHQTDLPSDQFQLDFSALTKSADPPVPSSQQVRSLFRSTTTTTTTTVTMPAEVPTGILPSTSNPLQSSVENISHQTAPDDSKLLSRLFDPASTTPTKRRANKVVHRATPEDDFLTVNFADADGDYTTAEQFNEALLLLGPQPSSPEEPPPQQPFPMDYDRSVDEPTASHQQSPRSNLNTLSEAVMMGETASQNAGYTNAVALTEQMVFVELEQVELEPDDKPVAQTALVTEELAQPKLNLTVETVSSQSPNSHTEKLEASTEADSVEESNGEVTTIEDHSNRETVAIPVVSNSAVPSSDICDASVTIEDMEPTTGSDKSCCVKTDSCKLGGTKNADSDEEATLAMRLEPSELPDQVVMSASSSSDVNLAPASDTTTKKRFVSRDTRPIKQLRTRSISLTAPLELASSTPTRRSSTTVLISRQNRRRLFSAPSQVPAVPGARQTRHSTARRLSSTKRDSASQPSCTSSSSTVSSRKLSSSGTDSTESKLVSTQSSSIEPCSQLLTDDTNTEPMQAQSILTVLASSSALLEAAAVDLALVSDSDVSPIKSRLGQLETLDRMLKNCQRRSQQHALDTTESNKSSVTTSSTESDAIVASRTDVEQSTIPMCCTQLGTSNEKLAVPTSTPSMTPDHVGTSVTASSPVAVDESETATSTGVKSRPIGRRRRRGKAVKRGQKKTSVNLEITDTSTVQRDQSADVQTEFMSHTESDGTELAEVSCDSRPPSTISLNPILPDTGLLFCASERPHSFGLSSEAIAAVQAHHNPVPNGDFSQHVPRLTLAITGPLFPDLPPSPTDTTVHECDLCKVPASNALQPQRLSPREPERTNSPRVLANPAEQSVSDAAEVQYTDTSKPSSGHVRHPHRKKRKRSRRSRSRGTVAGSDTSKIHEFPTGFVPRNTFDAAIIVPIHLTKPPAGDAPFARFANSELLPTFADVQQGNDGFGLKSNTGPSTWLPTPCPAPPLFIDQIKTSASETKTESRSWSPTTARLDMSSSDIAESSSDRTSINSNAYHDEEKSNPVACCSPSNQASHSPQPPAISTFSSGPLSLFAQPNHVQPAVTVPSFGLTPQLPSVIAAPPQLSKSEFTTTATDHASNPSASALSNGCPFNVDGMPNTTVPSLKLSTVPGFSSLSIPTTRIAGVTFGSFAGAAAFRATSFSALAAKAESGRHKSGSGLWTKQLTFSDLAKAASQSDSSKPSVPLAETGTNGALWAQSNGQTGSATFRLFHNCHNTETTNDRVSIKRCDAQMQPCDPPQSPKENLSPGTSTALSYSEDDSALSKVTTSDPSFSVLQSPIVCDPLNSIESREHRGPRRKGSRRRRGSRRASHSAHKSKKQLQQPVPVVEPETESVSVQETRSSPIVPTNVSYSADNDDAALRSSPLSAGVVDSTEPPSARAASPVAASEVTVEPKSEPASVTLPDATIQTLSAHSDDDDHVDQCSSPADHDLHREPEPSLPEAPISESPQPIAYLDHNQPSTVPEPAKPQDEVTQSSEHAVSSPVCNGPRSPSADERHAEPAIICSHSPVHLCSPQSSNEVTASPVLVDEIITLPLDQEDCMALIEDPTTVLADSNDSTEMPPTDDVAETHADEHKPDVDQSESGIAPVCSSFVASEHVNPETAEPALQNGLVESTGEQLKTEVSNACPPIRLRLSLKSALHNHSTLSGKKLKRSKQHHHTPSTQTPVTAQPRSSRHSSPVAAVVSSRTATSLSIRLTPKPKVSRVSVVQPLPPPQAHQSRSLSLGSRDTPVGSKRSRSRRGRKRRAIRRSRSDQITTVSVGDGSNPEFSHTTASVGGPTTAGNTVGCTQSYTVTTVSNSTITRTQPVTRSNTVSGPTARTAYPPRLGSVFAKKIFSTAKQDRRSSYAHLSQPWRSGIRGSPRKRGLSRTQSVTLSKAISGAAPITTPTVPDRAASPLARGSNRRGRVAFSGRGNGNARGVRRLGKRTSSIEPDLARKRGAGVVRSVRSVEDPPAIRLVIRLGKHVQRSSSNEHARTSSSVSPVVVAHSPSDEYPSEQEEEEMTLVRAKPGPVRGDRFYVSELGEDNDHVAAEAEDECLEPDNVESEDDADLNSTDELLPFEFCTATEAETYMDPNQVRIHRIVNRAVTTGVPVTDCFLGSDDEDEDDGVADSMLSASQNDRLVAPTAFAANHLSRKSHCLPQTSTYLTNAPPAQLGYASVAPCASSPPQGDRGRQKRKKRSDRIANNNGHPEPLPVTPGKRRCAATTPTHSPVTRSGDSCQSQTPDAHTRGSSNHYQHQPSVRQPDDPATRALLLPGPSDSSATSGVHRFGASSHETQFSNPSSYPENFSHGATEAADSNAHPPVAGMLDPDVLDVSTRQKSFADFVQYPTTTAPGPARPQSRPTSTVPPTSSYTAVHHMISQPPTFGTGSGAGASCGEGRSSSSTSSIVSVPALASVGSPGPDSQSDFAAVGPQHRLSHPDEPLIASPASRDEYGSAFQCKTTNPFTVAHVQSNVSPAPQYLEQRPATDTLHARSPYESSGRPMDNVVAAPPSHRTHSPQSVAVVVPPAHLPVTPALSASQSDDHVQPLSPVHEDAKAPTTVMQQQALAAATAYAAAAAYAGLDPMMAAHQHVKAYYDQWASSLFGSLAANPAEFQPPQPHPASCSADWSKTAADRMCDTRAFDTSSASSSWVWNNQRPAHLSRSGLFETESLAGECSAYGSTAAAGAPFHEFASSAASVPHHQLQHSNNNNPVAKDNSDYSATGHPMSIGASYPEHQLPHLAAHSDASYRHFHPGLEYGRRFGPGSLHEPRVNGW